MKELELSLHDFDLKATSKQNALCLLDSFLIPMEASKSLLFSLKNVFHNGLDDSQGLTLVKVSITNMSATLPVLYKFQHPRTWMGCCETPPAAVMEGPGIFLPTLLAGVI